MIKLLLDLIIICSVQVTVVTSLNNGVGLTPALGWSTWNYFWTDINETLVQEIADSFILSGLHQLGWQYINIDGGWALPTRDSNGNLQANPKLFPSGMKAMGDYIHKLGLKFGLYADISEGSCAGSTGSFGYYQQDANTFAQWGVDYLKVDYCGGFGKNNETQWQHWAEMRDALNQTNRHIYYSICAKTLAPVDGNSAPYKGQQIYSPPPDWTLEQHRSLANSWLVEYVNIVDNWYWGTDWSKCLDAGPPCGMITNLDAIAQMTRPGYAAPGAWNDADMLQVCNLGHHNGGMTNVEYRYDALSFNQLLTCSTPQQSDPSLVYAACCWLLYRVVDPLCLSGP